MSTSSDDKLSEVKQQLFSIANHDHSHLLLERRFSEWHCKCLASARARAAFNILAEEHPIHAKNVSGLSLVGYTKDWASSFFVD